jgi:hypothetical protein
LVVLAFLLPLADAGWGDAGVDVAALDGRVGGVFCISPQNRHSRFSPSAEAARG